MHSWVAIALTPLLTVAAAVTNPAVTCASPQLLSINASQVPPYHFPDGSGFEDRLIVEMFARLGVEVRIRDVPSARGLVLLEQGEDDGTLARNEAAARGKLNFVMIPEKVLDRDYAVFAKGKDIHVASWEGLARYRVGVMSGWRIVAERLPKAARVTSVSDHRQLFRLVENDRVDAVVFNSWGGLYAARELGLENVRPLPTFLGTEPSFFFLHRRHEALAAVAADALRDMKRDGTYDRIYDQILRPLEQR